MAPNASKYPLINKESIDDIVFELFAMHCGIGIVVKENPTGKMIVS